MRKQISPKIVSLIFAVLIVCFAVGFYAFGQWTEPGSPPPICPSGEPGCDAPVNIGGTTQYKSGALGIGGLFQTNNETHLAILGGSVGIGTTVPSVGDETLKLDVHGPVGATIYCDQDGNNCRAITEIGGGGQSAQVVGTTNVSLSTSWANASGMTINMTTTGGNVLLMFSASFTSTADHGDVYLRFTVDGVVKHTIADINPDLKTDAGETMPVSMQWLTTGLSAGSHTFRVQWKRGGYRAVSQKGANYRRVFTAMEVPD